MPRFCSLHKVFAAPFVAPCRPKGHRRPNIWFDGSWKVGHRKPLRRLCRPQWSPVFLKCPKLSPSLQSSELRPSLKIVWKPKLSCTLNEFQWWSWLKVLTHPKFHSFFTTLSTLPSMAHGRFDFLHWSCLHPDVSHFEAGNQSAQWWWFKEIAAIS